MIISIVAAYAKDHDGALVIGKDNKIPWHYPEDLARFKKLTKGHAVIMGRKTYESIGKALPDRTNVVITSQHNYSAPDAHVFGNLEAALACVKITHVYVFIIGGQKLFEQTIERADSLYLTSFNIPDIEGDTYFPPFSEDKYTVAYTEDSALGGNFRVLDRKVD